MTQEQTLSPGMTVVDAEATDGDEMLVLSVSDAYCNDEEAALVEWDFQMNPVTVADKNEEFGYAPDQPFATVAFVPALNRKVPAWTDLDHETVRKQVEDEYVKTYKYPIARLNPVERI